MLFLTMPGRKPKKPKPSEMPPWSELLAAFKALREKLALTQEAVGAKLHVTQRSVLAWEREEAAPSLSMQRLIWQFCQHPEEF